MRTFILLTGPILILAVTLAYIAFDVRLVNETVIERRGYKFNSLQESRDFLKRLSELSVPYSIEQSDDQVEIWWDDKYGQISAPNSQLLAGDIKELCFQPGSKSEFGALVAQLMGSGVPYTTYDDDNGYCARWNQKYDSTVQQIYPNLKKMRELETAREK